MDKEKLSRLNDLFQSQVDNEELFGSTVIVGTLDETLFFGEYGDMKADSFTMLCSMTKPITAIAAWILIERGIIDPMEEISKYLPKFKNPMVYCDGKLEPAKREVLIKDCLNMVSGITYGLAATDDENHPSSQMLKLQFEIKKKIEAGEKFSNVDIVNELGAIPLVFHPGEKWEYGKSADIIGAIVEAASGMTLGEFFRKEIFEPLEMHDTGFVIPKEDIMERKGKIAFTQEDGTIKEISDEEFYGEENRIWQQPYMENAGGGMKPVMGRGLYSTLNDYAKFARMLLNKGKYGDKRILSERTVEMFTKNALTDKQAQTMWPWMGGYGYANLMRTMVDTAKHQCNWSNGEFGWDGALGTYFHVDLATGIYVVHMQQRVQGDIPQTRRKMLNIIYSAM